MLRDDAPSFYEVMPHTIVDLPIAILVGKCDPLEFRIKLVMSSYPRNDLIFQRFPDKQCSSINQRRSIFHKNLFAEL